MTAQAPFQTVKNLLPRKGHLLPLLFLIATFPTSCQKPQEASEKARVSNANIVAEPVVVSSTKVPPKPIEPPLLVVLPMGRFPVEEIEIIKKAVETHYGWRIEILAGVTIPDSAWYAPRKRYRAERILDWISSRRPKRASQIMAVTQKDISTTKGKHFDWGICGLAQLGGEASVVSTMRIKRGLNRFPKKERHKVYLKRLGELVAHEFGHNRGLEHCPNYGCIMEDAKGTVRTFDHSTGKLCDSCQNHLKKHGNLNPK